jgi:exonuclease SbcC
LIITHLRAENVLKYARLQLDDLPRLGLIGISGSNESGKSTIGETICYALFGRTFSLDEEHLTKIIRWGENACQVTLGFVTGDGCEYEVTRHIDKNLTSGARLVKTSNPDEILARGNDTVTAMIQQLIGLGYPEYVESFYLAQREISAPHPHSDAVKSIAGVLPLEQLRDEFLNEIERHKGIMVDADENHIRLQGEIEALGFTPGVLEEMQERRGKLLESSSKCQQQAIELGQKSGTYLLELEKYRQAIGARLRSRLLQMALLIPASVAAVIWFALVYLGQNDMVAELAQQLQQTVQLGTDQTQFLVFASAGLGLLALILWIREMAAKYRIAHFSVVTSGYLEMLEQVQQHRASGYDFALLDIPASAVGVEIDDAEVQNLRHQMARQQAKADAIREVANHEVSWLNEVSKAESELAAQLVEQISKEEQRVKIVDSLRFEQGGHEQALEHSNHQLKVLKTAISLLDGATENLATAFNREVRERTAQLLPMLTQGRYEHIKLDENLNVEVLSTEKGDFMVFDEVSSGTQRQILLSVRLVISQALARDCVKGDQFLFLDEPFAFFDAERTQAGLNGLTGFRQLPQIFVIAQEFAENPQQFAMCIEIDRTATELIA